MFREDYRKELDNLTVSDEFKAEAIQLMKQKAQLSETVKSPADNTVKFKSKYSKWLKAAVFAIIASASLFAFTMTQSDYFIGTDSAAPITENSTHDNVTVEQAIGSGSENDKYLPAGTDKKYWLTIDDSEAIEFSANLSLNDKSRISYNLFNHGMGYEAHMAYGPFHLEFNPEYNLGDEFDSLPVYKFTPLAPNQALAEVNGVMYSLNASVSDVKFTWSRPLYYEDGQHCTNEEIVTYTTDCPGDEYTLNYIDGNIVLENGTCGDFSLWAGRGQMRLITDEAVSRTKKSADIFTGAEEKYPGLFNIENKSYRTWYDYMYFAEKNYNQYIYQKTDDYGQNIFNATVNNISVSVLVESEENPVPDQTCMWISLPYYTKEDELPAINYRQALYLLYNGQFYSSKTDTVAKTDVVQHTELVYLTPEYNMEIPGYDGYALPFYKFYIQDPDIQRETLGGILKEYYVCYVCALNPEYVDITGDYGADRSVQFNGVPVKDY